jgi:hypothetical protein
MTGSITVYAPGNIKFHAYNGPERDTHNEKHGQRTFGEIHYAHISSQRQCHQPHCIVERILQPHVKFLLKKTACKATYQYTTRVYNGSYHNECKDSLFSVIIHHFSQILLFSCRFFTIIL